MFLKRLAPRTIPCRSLSSTAVTVENVSRHGAPLDPSRLVIKKTTLPKPKLPRDKLVFGMSFADHMLEVDWDSESGWHAPVIHPMQDLHISPAASALHYALQCFEGMKAYKDIHGKLRLFRPDLNMQRLNYSMQKLYMPPLDGEAVIKLLSELIKLDKDWVPEGEGYSLYLRPTVISTYPFLGVGATKSIKLYVITSPVGPYYREGFNPIKLYADTEHVRAWPGGLGNAKVGGNYGPTILPQMKAQQLGCSQVLWLYGDTHNVTEVGAMNFLVYWINKDGHKELLTPPLSGEILPGVTRRSILELAQQWNEFQVKEGPLTMPMLVEAYQEGRLIEAFGAGTAAVVSPIKAIHYKGQDLVIIPDGKSVGPLTKRLWNELMAIQYGKLDHPWSWKIED